MDFRGAMGCHHDVMPRLLSVALSSVLALLVGAAAAGAYLVATGRVQVPGQLAGQASPTSTALAGIIQPSQRGTYWGAFVPGVEADPAVVTRFASTVGHQPAIVSMYQPWWHEQPFPAAAARQFARIGSVPLVVWEPWRPALPTGQAVDQPGYRLSVIAAGGFDRYVRRYADQARDFGGPVFLEPLHEMNGNWYPWGGTVNGNTADDFVAAWRHLRDVFLAEGATNVTWVWTANRDTVPNTPDNQATKYWPGSAYVDWVGLDAYNWGTAEHKVWMSVAETFDRSLRLLQTLGKPIIVAETACAEQGGDKARWIASLFAALTDAYRGEIGAAVWFDQPYGVFDWRVNSSPAAQAAFTAGVALPGILSGSPANWSARPA